MTEESPQAEDMLAKKSLGKKVFSALGTINNVFWHMVAGALGIFFFVPGIPILGVGFVLALSDGSFDGIISYFIPIYNLAPWLFNSIGSLVATCVLWVFTFAIFISDLIYGPQEGGQTMFSLILTSGICIYAPIISFWIIRKWCYNRGYSIPWPDWGKSYRKFKKLLGVHPAEKREDPKPHQPLIVSTEYEPPIQERHPIYEEGRETPQPKAQRRLDSMTAWEKLEAWYKRNKPFTDDARKAIAALLVAAAIYCYFEGIFIGALALAFLAGAFWYVSMVIGIVILVAINTLN